MSRYDSVPESMAQSRTPVVLLTDPIDADAIAPLEAMASVARLGDRGYEDIIGAVRQADIVIVRRKIPEEALTDAHFLRALIRNGVGLDFIPVEAASRLGIAVANTPGTNAKAVAEAAIGMMLAGFRRFALKDRQIREGEWAALRSGAFAEQEVSGKTLGLLGFGSIAREVARIAHFGFDMSVIAASRTHREGPAYVQQASLATVLSRCDVLVVACPLTDVTRGMIGADEIGGMKPGSAIVNIARGAIIVEEHLVAALKSGHLRFAALDVFSEQPPAPTNPLLSLGDCIFTPHTAGITQQAMHRMSNASVEEACRVLRGERPLNLINPACWEVISQRWGQLHVLNPMGSEKI